MQLQANPLERVEGRDGFVAYRSPLLDAACVPHLFTTRCGGTAGTFDLRTQTRDRTARACAALGLVAPIVSLHQVHGSVVHVAHSLPVSPPAADALVTADKGLVLLARVADCVPVLLASADGRHVAAVHAGWRGLIAGVIPSTLHALRSADSAGEQAAVYGAIGPCLSQARFEVGVEVAAAFEQADLGSCVAHVASGRPHVDLREAARLQLERADVTRVDVSDRCTWDDAHEFFSYRREVTHGGQVLAGHQGALIAVAR